ncbi:MAG: hypothetical protein KDK37_06745 [Leptospiraceae bacterium]|nr:hypothetical protein [Leptospiraceae bacterium]MCB1303955.1 hypothetical protein [Leptospiraceae bacterium]
MALYIASKHLHILIGYLLVLYGFLSIWLDQRIKKTRPIDETTRAAHRQYALAVKIAQYVTLVSLLTGIVLLNTYWSAGVAISSLWWAVAKVILFLALTGIMGAMGSIPLKRRLHALDTGNKDNDLHVSTAKKLQNFKLLQLMILVALAALGHYKPGLSSEPAKTPASTIQQESPSSQPAQEDPGSESETTEQPSSN